MGSDPGRLAVRPHCPLGRPGLLAREPSGQARRPPPINSRPVEGDRGRPAGLQTNDTGPANKATLGRATFTAADYRKNRPGAREHRSRATAGPKAAAKTTGRAGSGSQRSRQDQARACCERAHKPRARPSLGQRHAEAAVVVAAASRFRPEIPITADRPDSAFWILPPPTKSRWTETAEPVQAAHRRATGALFAACSRRGPAGGRRGLISHAARTALK